MGGAFNKQVFQSQCSSAFICCEKILDDLAITKMLRYAQQDIILHRNMEAQDNGTPLPHFAFQKI